MDYLGKINEIRDKALETEKTKAVLEAALEKAEERLSVLQKRMEEMHISVDSVAFDLEKANEELSEKLKVFFERIDRMNELLKKVISREITEQEKEELGRLSGNIGEMFSELTSVAVSEKDISISEEDGETSKKKKRGRPKGSRNKKKEDGTEDEKIIDVPDESLNGDSEIDGDKPEDDSVVDTPPWDEENEDEPGEGGGVDIDDIEDVDFSDSEEEKETKEDEEDDIDLDDFSFDDDDLKDL